MTYRDPENVPGYELIGIADPGGFYEWDVFAVWRKDGLFYWAQDAGCSCGSPWDCKDLPEDFEGPGSVHDAMAELRTWAGGNWADSEALMTALLGL